MGLRELHRRRFLTVAEPPVSPANTFIGGVATSIPTKAALATKLGILEGDISYFAVVGSDIEATIDVDYVILGSTFADDVDITDYKDTGKVTSVDGFAFSHLSSQGTSKLKNIVLPNATFVDRYAFSYLNAIEKIELNSLITLNGDNHFKNSGAKIYIPSIVSIGNNTTYSTIFDNTTARKTTVYLPPSFATVNGGGEEPDIASARSQGATINYIQNQTAPNQITDLSVNTVFATALQLNFTAPIGSINAIGHYQVYANGFYKGFITPGGYVTGLKPATDYSIEVKPVDIYYNKSTSNIVAQTTAISEPYPVSEIVSYYKTESNVLDSWGTNNGTANAIAYASGLVGQAAVMNGTTSEILIPDNDSLSFNGVSADKPFSMTQVIKFSSNGDRCLFMKGTLSDREYDGFLLASNKLAFRIFDKTATSAIYIQCSIDFTPTLGSYYVIHWMYSGNRLNTGMNIYVEEVKGTQILSSAGTFTGMGNKNLSLGLGKIPGYSSLNLSGSLEENIIWKTELSESQVSGVVSKIRTGQSLI